MLRGDIQENANRENSRKMLRENIQENAKREHPGKC